LALRRITHNTVNVQSATRFGSPQVASSTTDAPRSVAISLYAIACVACTKWRQPTQRAPHAYLREPVMKPIKKLISSQPHTRTAQLKATYAPLTLRSAALDRNT